MQVNRQTDILCVLYRQYWFLITCCFVSDLSKKQSSKKFKPNSSSSHLTLASDDAGSNGQDLSSKSYHAEETDHNGPKQKTPDRPDTPTGSNAGSEDNISDIESESSKGDYKATLFGLAKMDRKKKDPLDVLIRLFPNQPRSVLELVVRENHGDVLQAIEQAMNIQNTNTSNAMLSSQSNGSLPMNAGFLQRNPFFSRFYPPMNMDVMKSAFSPINMMNSAAANGMPRFPTDQSMMAFPYLGFRPSAMDFPLQSSAGNMGEMGLISKKK